MRSKVVVHKAKLILADLRAHITDIRVRKHDGVNMVPIILPLMAMKFIITMFLIERPHTHRSETFAVQRLIILNAKLGNIVVLHADSLRDPPTRVLGKIGFVFIFLDVSAGILETEGPFELLVVVVILHEAAGLRFLKLAGSVVGVGAETDGLVEMVEIGKPPFRISVSLVFDEVFPVNGTGVIYVVIKIWCICEGRR